MKILILCTGNSCSSQMAHGQATGTDEFIWSEFRRVRGSLIKEQFYKFYREKISVS